MLVVLKILIVKCDQGTANNPTGKLHQTPH